MRTSKSYNEMIIKIKRQIESNQFAHEDIHNITLDKNIMVLMTPSYSLTNTKTNTNEKIKNQKQNHLLVGIVFSDYAIGAGKEIFQSMNKFNTISGEYIDFYFAGYTKNVSSNQNTNQVNMQKINHEDWFYDPEAFVAFKDDFERLTTWEYNGHNVLILCTAYLRNNIVDFDFETTIICDLDAMLKAHTITDISLFFQDIFNYAKKASGNTQAARFSDAYAKKILTDLIPSIYETISKGNLAILNKIRQYKHLAIRNISKKST